MDVLRVADLMPDEEGCLRFMTQEQRKQSYLETELFGEDAFGEIVSDYKLTKRGLPTAEQKKIASAAAVVKAKISEMGLGENPKMMWLEKDGLGGTFHIYPALVRTDSFHAFGGIYIKLVSNVYRYLVNGWGVLDVRVMNSTSVALYLLNYADNIDDKRLRERMSVHGVNLIVWFVDLLGKDVLVNIKPNDVRISEGKQVLKRLTQLPKGENPTPQHCFKCQLECDKRIDSMYW